MTRTDSVSPFLIVSSAVSYCWFSKLMLFPQSVASFVADRIGGGNGMASPPKHYQNQSDGTHSNKLVNRLNLASLSLRPRWRVMVNFGCDLNFLLTYDFLNSPSLQVLGHHSVGKSGKWILFSDVDVLRCLTQVKNGWDSFRLQPPNVLLYGLSWNRYMGWTTFFRNYKWFSVPDIGYHARKKANNLPPGIAWATKVGHCQPCLAF